VIQATDGNFYGTTYAGGVGVGNSGTVFKITPTGTLSSLYSFCSQPNCADGALPAGLVLASNGNFYGTTFSGGSNAYPCPGDCGTVLEITPEGKLTTLYSFCSLSNCADGAAPEASLIQATDGDLYGTTSGGGTHGKGTVFKITLAGKLTTLHSFSGADGSLPYSGVVQATDGKIYGATYEGGTKGDGVIFSLSTGLRRFVKAEPTSGEVGSKVKILGTHLTGATAVSFNGTPASFKVCTSGKALDTSVPAGATSGTITVTLPTGTLTSNVVFTVIR
jgi:uncharacterized repeat protein (TIGR03803 family)